MYLIHLVKKCNLRGEIYGWWTTASNGWYRCWRGKANNMWKAKGFTIPKFSLLIWQAFFHLLLLLFTFAATCEAFVLSVPKGFYFPPISHFKGSIAVPIPDAQGSSDVSLILWFQKAALKPDRLCRIRGVRQLQRKETFGLLFPL